MKRYDSGKDNIDRLFAKEVAGLGDKEISFLDDDPNGLDYSSNMQSVIPFLKKWRTVKIDWDRISMLWSVQLGNTETVFDEYPARAAVVALLREAGFIATDR